MAARDPGRAVLRGIRPHGGWQGPGRVWQRVQDPSLFSWVLPHRPLGLHVPERGDVLVGGHLLHLQPLQQRQRGWHMAGGSRHSKSLGTPSWGPSRAASDRERGCRCWVCSSGQLSTADVCFGRKVPSSSSSSSRGRGCKVTPSRPPVSRLRVMVGRSCYH